MNALPTARVRLATEADAQYVRAILERAALPTSDLDASRPQFVVACIDGTIIGTGALEHFGPTALLRSVAVEPRLQGAGVGKLIVSELERVARENGVAQLVLLTQTANSFFQAHGYHVIDRLSAPATILDSEEFRSLCPASAICMAKTLA